MVSESKYPMTYEQYEKRVIELFLEQFDGEELAILKDKLDGFLEDNPNFIRSLYSGDCFTYDHPEIYSDNCKKVFEEYHLLSTPVAQLRMILEGG